MRDRWINLGCEDSVLEPYVEPEQIADEKRIGNSCAACRRVCVCSVAATATTAATAASVGSSLLPVAVEVIGHQWRVVHCFRSVSLTLGPASVSCSLSSHIYIP